MIRNDNFYGMEAMNLMIKKNTIHADPPLVRLLPSPCALCGSYENSNEIYPSNFDLEAFNPEVFSARRLPDRIHYRMVECKKCKLLRSDPVADSDTLLQLYIKSTFSYGNQIAFLKKTYGRYLELVKKVTPNATSLLEIGCGSGFFLEEAIKHGVPNVWGVEPSTNAASQAPINLQGKIILDVMRPNLFPKDTTFDIICLFQVLDHMPDPVGTLSECQKLLSPNGVILILNHDIEAWSAKLLGESSPIIDIEHTYLYSKQTLAKILEAAGLKAVEQGSAWNSYDISYLVKLFPFPKFIKSFILFLFKVTLLGKVPVRVPLGNLYSLSVKKQEF